MTIEASYRRSLGTMVAYGFDVVDFASELDLARHLGAEVLEIFPEWRSEPDPSSLRLRVSDAGLAIHSAHGCWGGQAIQAARVDLGFLDLPRHRESVEDLQRCVDWLNEAGGTCLVVHPGGLSDPEETPRRRAALARGLGQLAVHARGTGVVICVENMPPGVHPGSRMADLAGLVAELNQPELAVTLDTGHAHISADLGSETRAAGCWLRTTHVHDNNGSQDTHEPPGHGTIDWDAWGQTLDEIGYRGPIMLECIRQLRKQPSTISPPFLETLQRLTRGEPWP
ncbi:sugar phosphate isomerase/epimerase family protein [Singulisphaera acidiphila]|uniref:Sugar phosphate isomerase/epimerase n=1 Tax=Singulisphaera acidiphila (strain ATCC BAA-1392 / DSM 18658 / VKM B-2454 / MOB10) TaxID=886293 RepID=L0DCM1_SINAD|nr:sugar phosphate isomerase/epimerase family protein [Singulisphaera acidiphila]AGA26588.1 sugar phosphate isomerase/epimerase [Singulisphaera acidiphila DSM 18658]